MGPTGQRGAGDARARGALAGGPGDATRDEAVRAGAHAGLRRASRAERETVGRAGGSKWAAEKKGGGLGRSGWAGAGLTLVVGLFSISLFLILNQSNTFEFK